MVRLPPADDGEEADGVGVGTSGMDGCLCCC